MLVAVTAAIHVGQTFATQAEERGALRARWNFRRAAPLSVGTSISPPRVAVGN